MPNINRRWVFGRVITSCRWSLISRSGTLTDKTSESTLASPIMWGHKENMAYYEPLCRPTRTWSSSSLILNCPVTRIVRNNLQSLVGQLVSDQLLWSSYGLRHKVILQRWYGVGDAAVISGKGYQPQLVDFTISEVHLLHNRMFKATLMSAGHKYTYYR